MRSVSADRGFVLAAVDAVQKGATALDRTDEACISGKGSRARDTRQAGRPVVQKAREALSVLTKRVATYRSSLRALGVVSTAVEGTERDALAAVVRDGVAEAIAVERFRRDVAALWPRYDELEQISDTWITRALTPWYRTDQEGASAYTILSEPTRPALDAARAALGAAAAAVRGPSMISSGTLAAADRALSGLRAP